MAMTYVCVQICRNPAGLNCHQVTADPVEDWLEDGDALELGHGVVQDQAAGAADRHGHQDRGPSVVEDLNKCSYLSLTRQVLN